jgi:hypothetical protein
LFEPPGDDQEDDRRRHGHPQQARRPRRQGALRTRLPEHSGEWRDKTLTRSAEINVSGDSLFFLHLSIVVAWYDITKTHVITRGVMGHVTRWARSPKGQISPGSFTANSTPYSLLCICFFVGCPRCLFLESTVDSIRYY